MSLLSKPSVWFGCTLVIALVLVLMLPPKSPPPNEVGGIWLTPVEGGFVVNFQLISTERKTVPGKGILKLHIAQKIYPVGDEIGSKFVQDYHFSPADFSREEIGKGDKIQYIFAAATPVITYSSFDPPIQSGVLCRLHFSFLDYSVSEEIVRLEFTKEVRI